MKRRPVFRGPHERRVHARNMRMIRDYYELELTPAQLAADYHLHPESVRAMLRRYHVTRHRTEGNSRRTVRACGLTDHELAAKLGIPVRTLWRRRAKRVALQSLVRQGDARHPPAEHIARILSLHAQGLSRRAIARELGMAHGTIIRRCRLLGLSFNAQSRRGWHAQQRAKENPCAA
ncbi:hypothetical protein [Coralloluteibacterium thermophilus]|uniref:Helix-turn-helix domain-containing protein n=1 Tax=Coralloluteibacterium thermophilum TaxID=2707049 RepID=A0ABV9NFR7_9GAMM